MNIPSYSLVAGVGRRLKGGGGAGNKLRNPSLSKTTNGYRKVSKTVTQKELFMVLDFPTGFPGLTRWMGVAGKVVAI